MPLAQAVAKRLGAQDVAKLDAALGNAASGTLSKQQREQLASELNITLTQVTLRNDVPSLTAAAAHTCSLLVLSIWRLRIDMPRAEHA